jgi:hypothetical protein
VISKRECPHTGVINFFAASDPLIAIGSVSATPRNFAWRCYLDDPAGGTAPDASIAEAELKKAIALRHEPVVPVA